jgi:hypothetical protein
LGAPEAPQKAASFQPLAPKIPYAGEQGKNSAKNRENRELTVRQEFTGVTGQ